MEVVGVEEGGGGDGYGFVAGGEECPAVGAAFGDVEYLALFESVQYWQIVDAALRSLRELKTRLATRHEVAVLDADEVAVGVVVGDLEPVDAVAVAPGGEAAPADDAWVEAAGVEEEGFGGGAEVGAVEEGGVAGGVEREPLPGPSPWGERCGMLGFAGAVGEVEAGLLEVFVEEVADEVDGVAVGVADEAAVGVLPYVERQTGVVVVVEGA